MSIKINRDLIRASYRQVYQVKTAEAKRIEKDCVDYIIKFVKPQLTEKKCGFIVDDDKAAKILNMGKYKIKTIRFRLVEAGILFFSYKPKSGKVKLTQWYLKFEFFKINFRSDMMEKAKRKRVKYCDEFYAVYDAIVKGKVIEASKLSGKRWVDENIGYLIAASWTDINSQLALMGLVKELDCLRGNITVNTLSILQKMLVNAERVNELVLDFDFVDYDVILEAMESVSNSELDDFLYEYENACCV